MRIAVVGPPGAGKSHLGRWLAGFLRLPLYDLDDLYWQRGWMPTPARQWEVIQRDVAVTSTWIVAGNYQASLELRLRHATHLVLVDPGAAVCCIRLARRTLHRVWGDESAMPCAMRGQGTHRPGPDMARMFGVAIRYRRSLREATLELARRHGVPVVVVRHRARGEDVITAMHRVGESNELIAFAAPSP